MLIYAQKWNELSVEKRKNEFFKLISQLSKFGAVAATDLQETIG